MGDAIGWMRTSCLMGFRYTAPTGDQLRVEPSTGEECIAEPPCRPRDDGLLFTRVAVSRRDVADAAVQMLVVVPAHETLHLLKRLDEAPEGLLG
jgi:hypothetical protein